MRKVLILVLVGNIAWVLGGPLEWFRRKDRPEDTLPAKQSPSLPAVQPTYLDTLNRGKEIGLTEKDLVVINMQAAEEKTASNAKGASVRPRVVDGYRVQCFASSEVERARAQKTALEAKFQYPVYVIFENPFYKIHVGDFVKRSEAETVQQQLRAHGYTDAWIVSSKIIVEK